MVVVVVVLGGRYGGAHPTTVCLGDVSVQVDDQVAHAHVPLLVVILEVGRLLSLRATLLLLRLLLLLMLCLLLGLGLCLLLVPMLCLSLATSNLAAGTARVALLLLSVLLLFALIVDALWLLGLVVRSVVFGCVVVVVLLCLMVVVLVMLPCVRAVGLWGRLLGGVGMVGVSAHGASSRPAESGGRLLVPGGGGSLQG